MSNMNYDDSPYPVREDITAAHQRAWDRLSKAGSWLTGEERIKVFSGWMFASSPALSAMEHAIYDVWVVDCINASSSSDVRPG